MSVRKRETLLPKPSLHLPAHFPIKIPKSSRTHFNSQHFIIWHYIAKHFNVFHYTMLHYITFAHPLSYRDTKKFLEISIHNTILYNITLQYISLYFNILHYVASWDVSSHLLDHFPIEIPKSSGKHFNFTNWVWSTVSRANPGFRNQKFWREQIFSSFQYFFRKNLSYYPLTAVLGAILIFFIAPSLIYFPW